MDVALQTGREKKSRPLLGCILLLSFALNATGMHWGLPHYVDWATDNVSLSVLRFIANPMFYGGGSGYPPFHLTLLAIVCAPVLAYFKLVGTLGEPSRLFPYGFADPLASLSQLILVARAVSVLMGVAITLMTYRVVADLFDRSAARFAALIVALYYPLVYYAHNANVDVPYLFWTLLALHRFTRVLYRGEHRDYVWFAVFGMLAICTKDQSYGLFLLSPALILWARFAECPRTQSLSSRTWRVFLDRRFWWAGLAAAITFIVAQQLWFNPAGFLHHVQQIGKLGLSQGEYAPVWHERLQLAWHALFLLATGLTWPLFGVCLAGTVYCAVKFPRYVVPLLLLAASYYLTFINVILLIRPGYVLPIGILLAFFGGKLMAVLWRHPRWHRTIRPVICLVFAYAALFPLQLDWLFLRESRFAAEQWMQTHMRPGAIVETFAFDRHLRWYCPRFPSWVKVRGSKIEAGTQWEPYDMRPDKVRLPNRYFGREAPDYIVLYDFADQELLLKATARVREEKQQRNDLIMRLDYTLVATFKTPVVVPIRLLPINPRIRIFARRGERLIESHSSRPAVVPEPAATFIREAEKVAQSRSVGYSGRAEVSSDSSHARVVEK